MIRSHFPLKTGHRVMAVGACVGFLLLSHEVFAGPTTLHVQSVGNPRLGINAQAAWSGGSKSSTWAGSWMMTYVSGDATYIPGGGTWRSWCSDINAGMTSGNFLFEASQFPEGLPAGGTNPTWVENGGLRAAYLYHKYAPTIGLTDDIKASAMAIAIWEVLYDQNNDLATYGLNGGQWGFLAAAPDPASSGFQAVQLAQSWLNSAASVDFGHADGSWDYNMTYWRPLQTPGVNYLQQGGFGPVPEPAEIALVMTALIGLAMGYKRVSSGRKETQKV